MKCPSCGAPDQEGNFCAQCGAALGGQCPSCGAAAVAGGRHCTQCGQRLVGGRRGPHPAWYVAGAALLLVVLVLFIPRQTDPAGPRMMTDPAAAPGAGAPFQGGAASGDGLLSTDMRANADRLFSRIMTAAEEGNRAEVDQFMPMAVQAYGMVPDLDEDGLYHLAILHLTAGEHAQAIETAGRVLEDSPDHVLALGVAAAAAAESGDSARASELYRRLLDVYEVEAAKPLPEYVGHQRMLPEYRRAAREYLGEA